MKATNNFIWVIRDKTSEEVSGLLIPGVGRTKPHTGTVVTVGVLTKDGNLKNSKGKKVLFHQTVGFEIEYEKTVYLILEDSQVIGVE